ncbi:transglutaminase-like cysteine peptidase [bacterium]|nr:transglutaminase-like cysteine peptidase [bacterium]
MPFLTLFSRTGRASTALAIALLTVTLAVAQADFSLMQKLAYSRYGPETVRLVDEWEATIESMQGLSHKDKLVEANQFFNTRIQWAPDPDAWGRPDYWATPLEIMGRGMADCEDFAIAKYITLILAGVDSSQLRITYVKAKLPSEGGPALTAHMVLAYYPSANADPLILDNLVTDILPASQRRDLTPVYGFNSLGIWVGGAPNPASREPESRLSRWRDLLRRAAEEGLG